MSALTQALVDVGFNARRAEAIESAVIGAIIDTAQLADGAVTTAKIEDDAVTTAKIANDQVTNAKLADMAQATIKGRATGAGTGDPTDLTGAQAISVITGGAVDAVSASGNRWGILPVVGTDGVMEVGRIIDFHNTDADTDDNDGRLRSDDIANELTWSGEKIFHDGDFTAPAAGMVLLNSGTVTNAATLDIVLTAFTAYRAVKFVLSGFVPATDDAELWMRFSTDGGANYDATGYRYSNAGSRDNSAGTSVAILTAGGTAANQIILTGEAANQAASNVAAEGGVDAEITIFGRTDTARWTRATWKVGYLISGGEAAVLDGSGSRSAAQDTNAVRFLFSTGNIASGNWALYGYA